MSLKDPTTNQWWVTSSTWAMVEALDRNFMLLMFFLSNAALVSINICAYASQVPAWREAQVVLGPQPARQGG